MVTSTTTVVLKDGTSKTMLVDKNGVIKRWSYKQLNGISLQPFHAGDFARHIHVLLFRGDMKKVARLTCDMTPLDRTAVKVAIQEDDALYEFYTVSFAPGQEFVALEDCQAAWKAAGAPSDIVVMKNVYDHKENEYRGVDSLNLDGSVYGVIPTPLTP
jgi:hypothetical protein